MTSTRIRSRAVLGWILAATASPAISQTTWHVDAAGVAPGTGSASDPYTSIQYAIERPATVNGDTILVAPGDYPETITTHVGNAYKRVDLRSSAGPAVTAIRSDAVFAVELFNSSVIDGFTVRGHTTASGFGVAACGATVRRCVLRDKGVGLYACVDSKLFECTVTANGAPLDVSPYDVLEIRNSIVWGNAHAATTTNTTASWSVFDSSYPGATNQQVDPAFWNAAAGDVHVRPGSPCIDAGDPASPLDTDGSRIDVGALTYEPSYAFPPASYCASELNGDGCYAVVSASGACSATSAAPFWVMVGQVPPNKTVRMLYSLGASSTPIQGGTLCLASPILRTAATSSGSNGMPPPLDACSGTQAFDFNARIQSGADPLLAPGTLVYCQFRYRDPLDPLGYGVGWSDAVCFGIAP